MIAVALGAACVIAGLCAWGWSNERRARDLAQQSAQRNEQQVATSLALVQTLSVTEWQRSIQRLTAALVSEGLCRAAALIALTEGGELELRASAFAAGEPGWDPTTDSHAAVALQSSTPLPLASGGWILPIRDEDESIGLLAVRGLPAQASGGPVPVLGIATRLAAMGLSGSRHYQRQLVLSNTDGLTGLANHRHFQQLLGVALGQSYLEGETLSLILLDIDRFKAVNDTYGHLLGDLVLREIAYLLRRELPSDATPARYGGEEMVVLLQGENARKAPAVAERLRQVIEAHQVFDYASGSRLTVTVSLGVAQYELGQGKGRLIARADEALYRSKREGRNRVTVSPMVEEIVDVVPS